VLQKVARPTRKIETEDFLFVLLANCGKECDRGGGEKGGKGKRERHRVHGYHWNRLRLITTVGTIFFSSLQVFIS